MVVDEKKSTVFIVDDDASMRKSLGRLLNLEGYPVSAFSSARGFLESVPPDATGCLISDIYMPETDGFMLKQKMHELGYRLPVIFMSAYARAGDREFALEHGAAGFLLKPFDSLSLLDLLERVTQS